MHADATVAPTVSETMQAGTAYLWALVLVVPGCAAPAAPHAVPAPRPAVAAKPAEIGRILAIHAVPAGDPPAVRMLIRGASSGGPAGVVEYIVRAAGGATIAVVQPAIEGLRRGDRVRITRGAVPAIESRLQAAGG